MEGNLSFSGILNGEISGEGGGGVTPHVTATAQVDANTGTPTEPERMRIRTLILLFRI